MKKSIIHYQSPGKTFAEIVEAEPECGDFCDTCGDCLYCYPEGCYNGEQEHLWVEYDSVDTSLRVWK